MTQPWKRCQLRMATAMGAALALGMAASPAQAADDPSLRDRIEQMERELAALKAQVAGKPDTVAASGPPAQAQPAIVPSRPEPLSRRLALPDSPLSGSRLLIAGYADAGLTFSDKESVGGTTFIAGTFNPALFFQYGDWLLFEGEAEIEISEAGETEFTLEYSQLDLLLHDNATLVIGKFLSPVGQFQERLHPSWINRLADAPAGFGHDGLQPGAEVGLQLRGGVPVGRSRLNYALAVGNGPRLDAMGAVMTEGFGGDDNRNKAISGRIGILPIPYVEVGVSFLRAKVRGAMAQAEGEEMESASLPASIASVEGGGAEGPVLPAVRYSLWGVDAAYTRGPWDVRFEYLSGVRKAIPVEDEDGMAMEPLPRLKMKAWYGQLAYRLSGVTQHPILQNLEPAIRYGRYQVRGLDELAEEAAERRLDIGLNYWLAPAIVLHSAVQLRKFTARHEDQDDKDTRLLLQLAYGF